MDVNDYQAICKNLYGDIVYSEFSASLADDNRAILTREDFQMLLHNREDEAQRTQQIVKKAFEELRKKNIISKRFSFEEEERVALLTTVFTLAYNNSSKRLITAAKCVHPLSEIIFQEKCLNAINRWERIRSCVKSKLFQLPLHIPTVLISTHVLFPLLQSTTRSVSLLIMNQKWCSFDEKTIKIIQKIFKTSGNVIFCLFIITNLMHRISYKPPHIPYLTNFFKRLNLRERINFIWLSDPMVETIKKIFLLSNLLVKTEIQMIDRFLDKKIKREKKISCNLLLKTFLTLKFDVGRST